MTVTITEHKFDLSSKAAKSLKGNAELFNSYSHEN